MMNGEIWWVDFQEPRGSTPVFVRPGIIEDSGLIFYFLVDTGNTLSFINENGCQKMNFDLDENEDLLGGSVNLYLEDERYLVDGKEHILRMPVRKNEFFSEKEIDGMLGIDFLSQYDNVVLDY